MFHVKRHDSFRGGLLASIALHSLAVAFVFYAAYSFYYDQRARVQPPAPQTPQAQPAAIPAAPAKPNFHRNDGSFDCEGFKPWLEANRGTIGWDYKTAPRDEFVCEFYFDADKLDYLYAYPNEYLNALIHNAVVQMVPDRRTALGVLRMRQCGSVGCSPPPVDNIPGSDPKHKDHQTWLRKQVDYLVARYNEDPSFWDTLGYYPDGD